MVWPLRNHPTNGIGGMGEAYLAEDLKSTVASPSKFQRKSQPRRIELERFVGEAKAASA